MLAQVDSAHMHTNCYFSFVNPPGQKLHMQAFCCLTGAGQTWPGELRIFATHTHTAWWSHCVREGEHEVFVATGPRESVCVCVGGGGICCALWEMGVRIRHNCRMTFCSERFPHPSRGKQRRITQCKPYSTQSFMWAPGKGLCCVLGGVRVCVCTCTTKTQIIKDIWKKTKIICSSQSLIQR